MNPTIRVAIVSRTTMMRQCLVKLLQSLNKIEVVFSASDQAQVLDHLNYQVPDIVLVSVEMSQLKSLELLTSLKEFPDIKTIILLDDESDARVLQFLEQEANAILSKSVTLETLERVISEVHAKGFYYTADIMQVISRRLDRLSVPSEGFGITTREAEVLHLVCQGKSSRQIAGMLFITIKTVENHRYNLLRKTSSKNQVELRQWAASLYNCVEDES